MVAPIAKIIIPENCKKFRILDYTSHNRSIIALVINACKKCGLRENQLKEIKKISRTGKREFSFFHSELLLRSLGIITVSSLTSNATTAVAS